MRLYAGKIPHIMDAVCKALVDPGHIETSNREEFKRDVESVLREYLRKDRELTESAKDLLEQRGLPYSDLYRTKRQLAEREDFAIGDESINWIATQMIEVFMRSSGMPSNSVSMSPRWPTGTPTLPTSPRASTWSAS